MIYHIDDPSSLDRWIVYSGTLTGHVAVQDIIMGRLQDKEVRKHAALHPLLCQALGPWALLVTGRHGPNWPWFMMADDRESWVAMMVLVDDCQ